MQLSPEQVLPNDADAATLIGRAWIPGNHGGPAPVALRAGRAWDLTRVVPTSAQLTNSADPARVTRDALARGWAKPIGRIDAMLENSAAGRRDPARPYFLAPCDLQALRACGVTFVSSMLERVIEEHAKGDSARAEDIRNSIAEEIGTRNSHG
jgi:fumarylacetoacetate (FAA) hydrolase family protein